MVQNPAYLNSWNGDDDLSRIAMQKALTCGTRLTRAGIPLSGLMGPSIVLSNGFQLIP